MKIFDYFDLKDTKWIDKIRCCNWKAAGFLADLLLNNKFHQTLGDGKLFIMTEGENIVSFCTLTQRDCIDDESLFLWVGFVFTSPEYRGKRYSGEIIEFACEEAKKQGYDKVYIATDHIGLYEKYGFTYLESRIDIYGEESRIYYKEIQ